MNTLRLEIYLVKIILDCQRLSKNLRTRFRSSLTKISGCQAPLRHREIPRTIVWRISKGQSHLALFSCLFFALSIFITKFAPSNK